MINKWTKLLEACCFLICCMTIFGAGMLFTSALLTTDMLLKFIMGIGICVAVIIGSYSLDLNPQLKVEIRSIAEKKEGEE